MRRLATIILLLFIGCSRPEITSNSSAGTDFRGYTTFCFAEYDQEMPVARPDYNNPGNRQIIENAIITELQQQGFA